MLAETTSEGPGTPGECRAMCSRGPTSTDPVDDLIVPASECDS